MARYSGAVLVDANVIIEAHGTQTWSALAGGYQIETVEACVAETQTGFQRRRQEQKIDQSKLRDSLFAVYDPSFHDQVKLTTEHPDIWLDDGEASLWTHALKRADDWLFCGPDKASLKLGCKLGFKQQLVSMERLLKDIGVKAQKVLHENYTQSWHERFLTSVALQP